MEVQLTPDQMEAREILLTRVLLQAKEHSSLTGHAGTGKTTTASQLAEDFVLEYGQHRVFACAPTHKAAKVLDSKLPLEAQTIHTFLGLKVVPDNHGGYRLMQNPGHTMPESGVVLLDESSMVGKNLMRFIKQARGLSWVFIGDPAQLPPVAEQPSEALTMPGAQLRHIVRQAEGNPILRFATLVREGKEYLGAAGFADGIGVAVTHSSKSFLDSAVKVFADQPENRPPDVRILAYRNAVVKSYNDRVRSAIHGSDKLPRFLQGDWLMMQETWYDGEVAVVKNSEEVRVLHVEEEDVVTVGGFWKVYSLTVQRENSTIPAIIPILHESEERRYGRTLAQFKNEAIEGNRPWKDYYDLQERFARADYAYAMTTHKSQGSTFHTVYVDHRDLQACKNKDERQALIYVAATRPSHRLAMLI